MTLRKRVLIAEDHEMVRAGIAQFIAEQPDLEVTAEAGTGDEAIRHVREGHCDVVLLDISMPDKNGIDCLRVLKQTNPTMPVLVLTGYPEERYAINTLRAGAKGFISKTAAPEELLKAIRRVAVGRRYVSEAAAGLLTDELAHPDKKLAHETLSQREFQIFLKLAAGRTPTEIGEELHLSVKTVSTYRSRVLEKMNCRNNADLTNYAISNGLLA